LVRHQRHAVSAEAKLTNRIRKVHLGAQQGDWSLEVITTVDDPAYYTRPWSWATAYVWRPDKAPVSELIANIQLIAPTTSRLRDGAGTEQLRRRRSSTREEAGPHVAPYINSSPAARLSPHRPFHREYRDGMPLGFQATLYI